MPLGITVDKANPALNETYQITVSPPSGGAFHHHLTLYASADGGTTWNAIQTWQTFGSSTPVTYSTSKSSPGSFQYKAIDYFIDNSIADQSSPITVTVGGVSPTSLVLTADPAQCIHDPPSEGVVALTATLTSGGSALSGKTLTFKVYDPSRSAQYYSTTATTGTDGKATLQITPSLWTFLHPEAFHVQIGAEFAGDATYGASASDWVEVKWYGVGTTLTLTAPSSIDASVQFQLQAILKTSPGAVLANKNLRLLRGGTEVAVATTNSQGTAYFYQTLNPGTYSFQVVYDGQVGSFAPSQSSPLSISVTGTGILTLSATAGAGQITYDWSEYEGTGFHHYRLKVGTSSGGSDTANLTFSDIHKTSHVQTALTNDITYYATIYAEDASNTILAQSEEVTATPKATTYTEVDPSLSSLKISLTRAVSGQIISSSDWNSNEVAIEEFTGKIYLGSLVIPPGIKDVKVNLPAGLPVTYKLIGTLESKIPTAFSLEEITSSYFLLHLSASLPYSSMFHFILWGA